MKKEFPSNIPIKKLEELEKIKQVILEVSKEIVKVEMIILFWSYARWDFVEADLKFVEWHYEEYKSDFDILLVTWKPSLAKALNLENEVKRRLSERNEIKTPLTLIIEDIYHINKRLTEERYFYVDIEKEGIILYDSEKFKLKRWKALTQEERMKLKKEDFEEWFEKWNNSLKVFDFSFKENMLNKSAFELHQWAEWFITSYMLVKTWYKPKTHDLKDLYEMLVKEDRVFENWFDLRDEKEQKHFELLKTAYVDARYSKYYKITKDELKFLEEKVLSLKGIVDRLFGEELN